MAQIIRNGAIIVDNVGFNQSETFATNYWGTLSNEKMFPVAFWKVRQLLGASSSNTIALRVTNITNPDIVEGRWIAFEEALADTLQDPVELGVYYFIMDDKFFNGPILTATDPIEQIKGIGRVTNFPEKNIIWGRLGKEVRQVQEGGQSVQRTFYYAFFNAAECKLLGSGGGSEGGGTGFKIPSN